MMLESMFKKWNELCQVAATGVLVSTNRVLDARIVGLNSQVKNLVAKLADAENRVATFDALVATLNGAIKELQVDNERLRQSPQVAAGEVALDQAAEIEDLRRTVRAMASKCEELTKRRRATKAEHVLVENVRNHLNACGAMRVKLAADGLPFVYYIGDVRVPFDAMLDWYMTRVNEAVSGAPFGDTVSTYGVGTVQKEEAPV